MNQEAVLQRPKTFHVVLNILLMLFNLLMAYSSAVFLFMTRRIHIEHFIDPQTGQYPGPALADFFLRKEFIIIPILLIIYMVVQEFRIKIFRKRVYKNLLVLVGIYGHVLFMGLVPFIFLV